MAENPLPLFSFNKLETFFPLTETAPEYYCKGEKLTLFLWSSLLERRDFLTFRGEENEQKLTTQLHFVYHLSSSADKTLS